MLEIGRYRPLDTFVHRLDPRVKIGLGVALTLAALAAGPAGQAVLGAAVITLAVISGTNLPRLAAGLRGLWLLLLITGLFNAFGTPGEPLFRLGALTLTDAGLARAALLLVRLALIVLIAQVLASTVSPTQLTAAIEALLAPLRRIGLPVGEFALMASIALRFVPTLAEEADKVRQAQLARGADFETGGLVARARKLLPLLIPLFARAFQRAEMLADAMEVRAYRPGRPRTRLRPLQLRLADGMALAAGLLVASAVIWLPPFRAIG